MGIDTSTNRLYFDAAAQAITGRFSIIGIFWVCEEGAEIAADNDFLLLDTNDKKIIGKRAKFGGDDLGITLARPGLPVDGIKVSKLDGGHCYVWVA